MSLFQGLIGAVRTYLFADTTNRIDITLGAEVINICYVFLSVISIGVLLVNFRLAWLNWVIFVVSSLAAFSTLALDAVFSVIYIAVMVVYSGVLTAVTLGVIPLVLGSCIRCFSSNQGPIAKGC